MVVAGSGAQQDDLEEEEETGILLEPPRAYLIHFVDDHVFRPLASFKDLAWMLDPCRVVSLGFNEEAFRCETVEEIAALYRRRLLEDLQQHPTGCGAEAKAIGATGLERIILIGYAFGAIIAHQIAL